MQQLTTINYKDLLDIDGFYMAILGSEGNNHGHMWIRAINGTFEKFETIYKEQNWVAIPLLIPSDYVLSRFATLEECLKSYIEMPHCRVYKFVDAEAFFSFISAI